MVAKWRINLGMKNFTDAPTTGTQHPDNIPVGLWSVEINMTDDVNLQQIGRGLLE